MDYYLAHACHNTFLIFDCMRTQVDEALLQRAHQCLLKEGRDDALLLTKGVPSGSTLHVEMLVLGCDGTLAEFCGNGARAIAAYLFSNTHYETVFLGSKTGFVSQLQKKGQELYSITLPPACFQVETPFIANVEKFQAQCAATYVNMLEPHLVIHKEMGDEELMALGRKLNQKKDLFPYGININACHQISPDTLFVKTYERGVQRLTRSCSTGAASCVALHGQDATVITPGGTLEIQLNPNGLTITGIAQLT